MLDSSLSSLTVGDILRKFYQSKKFLELVKNRIGSNKPGFSLGREKFCFLWCQGFQYFFEAATGKTFWWSGQEWQLCEFEQEDGKTDDFSPTENVDDSPYYKQDGYQYYEDPETRETYWWDDELQEWELCEE